MVKNGNRKECDGQTVKRHRPNRPIMARAASRDVREGIRPHNRMHAVSKVTRVVLGEEWKMDENDTPKEDMRENKRIKENSKNERERQKSYKQRQWVQRSYGLRVGSKQFDQKYTTIQQGLIPKEHSTNWTYQPKITKRRDEKWPRFIIGPKALIYS